MVSQLRRILVGKDEDARRVCHLSVKLGQMAQVWRGVGFFFPLNCTVSHVRQPPSCFLCLQQQQQRHFDRITVERVRRVRAALRGLEGPRRSQRARFPQSLQEKHLKECDLQSITQDPPHTPLWLFD